MKYFFLLLLFIGISCNAQENSIEIQLKSDSLIYTEWIKLYEMPLFQKPYIKIHSTKGSIIKLEDINYYKGCDQNGRHRFLQTIDYGFQNRSRFSEHLFSKDSTLNLKIYYDQHIFGGEGIDIPSGSKSTKYTLYNHPLKKVNYKNLKKDLADNELSKGYLKSANQIRFLQIVSTGLGVALISSQILINSNPTGKNFLSRSSKITLMTGGALLIVPFTLEKAKRTKLLNALKHYEKKL